MAYSISPQNERTKPYHFSESKEKAKNLNFKGFSLIHRQAADGNRTRDLRTTNATLYRLSHSSVFNVLRNALDYSTITFR